MYLAVAGVQDIFAAHAALEHFTCFPGGTILVHRTGFVGIALWYQLVADTTYGGSSYATYGRVLGGSLPLVRSRPELRYWWCIVRGIFL